MMLTDADSIAMTEADSMAAPEAARMSLQNAGAGTELYVHIPFCVKKCDYCDFLSGPASREGQEIYVSALLREIRLAGEELPGPATTVFIGGGTPSVLASALMEKILDALRRNFRILPAAEFTVEANPGTLTPEKLKLYRSFGVNRLSLGLQSPKDGELALLGRIHDYRQFLESFSLARETGFSNINVDLMSALPQQTREGWTENLRTAAALHPEHISAYSLIVEEGTPFAKRALALPDEDTEYEMYEDTARILGEYGYGQYEISNYARPCFACRHNLGYWERTPYLGLGLGAASLLFTEKNPLEGQSVGNGAADRVGNEAAERTGGGKTERTELSLKEPDLRFSNTRSMDEYIKAAGSADFLHKIRKNREILSTKDQMSEFLFLGLRKTAGISKREFEENFGKEIVDVYGPVIDKYKKLALLDDCGGRIALTRKGIHVSNVIMADFLL